MINFIVRQISHTPTLRESVMNQYFDTYRGYADTPTLIDFWSARDPSGHFGWQMRKSKMRNRVATAAKRNENIIILSTIIDTIPHGI